MKIRQALQDVSTINSLMTGAEHEARQAGDSMPGAEHLLLSAIALADGTARRAFARVGADPEQLHAAIETAHAGALRDIGVGAPDLGVAAEPAAAGPSPGLFRARASLDEAFQAAVKLSKAGGGSGLLGAHVVIAVCQMERGTAARALRSLGVQRTELAAAAADELATAR